MKTTMYAVKVEGTWLNWSAGTVAPFRFTDSLKPASLFLTEEIARDYCEAFAKDTGKVVEVTLSCEDD